MRGKQDHRGKACMDPAIIWQVRDVSRRNMRVRDQSYGLQGRRCDRDRHLRIDERRNQRLLWKELTIGTRAHSETEHGRRASKITMWVFGISCGKVHWVQQLKVSLFIPISECGWAFCQRSGASELRCQKRLCGQDLHHCMLSWFHFWTCLHFHSNLQNLLQQEHRRGKSLAAEDIPYQQSHFRWIHIARDRCCEIWNRES